MAGNKSGVADAIEINGISLTNKTSVSIRGDRERRWRDSRGRRILLCENVIGRSYTREQCTGESHLVGGSNISAIESTDNCTANRDCVGTNDTSQNASTRNRGVGSTIVNFGRRSSESAHCERLRRDTCDNWRLNCKCIIRRINSAKRETRESDF